MDGIGGIAAGAAGVAGGAAAGVAVFIAEGLIPLIVKGGFDIALLFKLVSAVPDLSITILPTTFNEDEHYM